MTDLETDKPKIWTVHIDTGNNGVSIAQSLYDGEVLKITVWNTVK